MLRIGLTGGIGSGKSTVAQYFAELGVPVIDTDAIARDVVLPDSLAFKKIAEHFGSAVITAKGELNRQALRDIIFKSELDRKWLESLLHPLIRKVVAEQVAQAKSPYCVLVIPLLVESKSYPMIDRILVVDAPEEQQLARAQKRDQLTKAQVEAIMKAQAIRAERLTAANDVISNDGDLQHLHEQIKKLHESYLQLAKK